MDFMLERLKGLYDAKQAKQSELGKLAKLGEEAAELSAAISKYVQIKSGLYPSRSSEEKAYEHVLEEVCDTYQNMMVCRLTPDTATTEMKPKLIDRIVYKAFRFIDRTDLYKVWKKKNNTNTCPKKSRSLGIISVGLPTDLSGVADPCEHPFTSINIWGAGLEGDFE